MNARLIRASIAALVAVAGLLSFQAGNVQAHPRLTGRWEVTPTPGVTMKYEFGPGDYVASIGGGEVWRGCYTYFLNGKPLGTGEYELRIFSGTQASLGLRDGPLIATTVALIDLGAERVMTFRNLSYVFRP